MSNLPARYNDTPAAVIDLLPAYVELAGRIARTEFVPKPLYGRPEAVLAALMSGAERGLGPMESLRSVHIIEGRPTLSAEAMRALVLAAGHTIDIIETSPVRATVTGRRNGSDSTSPPFTWTIDRARRARLVNKDNWQKYPEAMLLARASTDLCRALFPDVIAGLASTEELTDELAPPEPSTSRRVSARRRSEPEAAALESSPTSISVPTTDETKPTPGELDVVPEPEPAPAPAPSEGLENSEPDTPPHDLALARRIHAEISKVFHDQPPSTQDRWRHALCIVVTRRRDTGPVASSAALDTNEQLQLSALLNRFAAGQATMVDMPDGTVEIRVPGGWRYNVDVEQLAVAVRQGEPLADVGASAGEPPPPVSYEEVALFDFEDQ